MQRAPRPAGRPCFQTLLCAAGLQVDLRPNLYYGAPMRLHRLVDVQTKCLAKFGSPNALESELLDFRPKPSHR